LFGTTRQFLDDLGLQSLNDLPAIDDLAQNDEAIEMMGQKLVQVSAPRDGDDDQEAVDAELPSDDQAVAGDEVGSGDQDLAADTDNTAQPEDEAGRSSAQADDAHDGATGTDDTPETADMSDADNAEPNKGPAV
jgi:segregation and condensation protein B